MSLLARLIEAGTPADLIEEVALLVAEKRAADERRRKDRERKRNGNSTDSTEFHGKRGIDRKGAENPLSLPPNENNSNPPTHTPPDNTPRARKADPFPCPDWCEQAVWDDLKRNRRTKKLTNTATAHRKFVSEVEAMADDHWPPGKLVEAIAAKGWGGAYDPRDDRKPQNDRQQSQHARGSTATAAAGALARITASQSATGH